MANEIANIFLCFGLLWKPTITICWFATWRGFCFTQFALSFSVFRFIDRIVRPWKTLVYFSLIRNERKTFQLIRMTNMEDSHHLGALCLWYMCLIKNSVENSCWPKHLLYKYRLCGQIILFRGFVVIIFITHFFKAGMKVFCR